MTEGIIQEVIKTFMNWDYLNNYSNKFILKELEHELIKKIKQIRHTKGDMNGNWYEYVYYKELIGDSE